MLKNKSLGRIFIPRMLLSIVGGQSLFWIWFARGDAKSGGAIFLIQIIIFAVTGIFLYFFFENKIGKPLEDLRSGLNSLAKGGRAENLKTDRNGEIGEIARGILLLKDNFNNASGKLNSGADNVGLALGQFEQIFRNVNNGLRKQGSSISEIAAALKSASEAQRNISLSAERLAEFTTENVTSLLQVKATAEEIALSTGRLFQAIEDSYSALAEFTQSSKEIAASAQEGSQSIEETSASLEEINASVKEIEQSIKESAVLADKVREIAAEEGVISITEAIEEMEKVTEQVRTSVQMVGRLGNRSKDIEKMLLVIRDVTEQTNLLSLNAAILAAQAGEFGKGFSVVADEMHALSERTAGSTKEIAAVVKTIQGEITEALASIEATLKFVQRGTEKVYKAGTITATIVETAQGSSGMAKTIQRATEEQVKGLGQISVSVEHMRDLVFKMAQATEEQFKGSEYMLNKMADLKEIAETSSKGSREQAEGTKHISQNLEMANERITGIKDSIQDQQKLHMNIVSVIENIKNIGLGASKYLEEMSASLGALRTEADSLKKTEAENGKIHSF